MLYEQPTDRAAQAKALQTYCGALGFTFTLTPPQTPWDAYIVRQTTILALAEVKIRRVNRWAYPTYKVDQRKVDGLVQAAHGSGWRALWLVQFRDGLCRMVLSEEWLAQHARVSQLARIDRHDPLDIDTVYEWSNDLWVPVGNGVIRGRSTTYGDVVPTE